MLAPDRRFDYKCCKMLTLPCPATRRPVQLSGDKNI